MALCANVDPLQPCVVVLRACMFSSALPASSPELRAEGCAMCADHAQRVCKGVLPIRLWIVRAAAVVCAAIGSCSGPLQERCSYGLSGLPVQPEQRLRGALKAPPEDKRHLQSSLIWLLSGHLGPHA